MNICMNNKFFIYNSSYNDQLKVFYVGGPNQRTDYHVELGEEVSIRTF